MNIKKLQNSVIMHSLGALHFMLMALIGAVGWHCVYMMKPAIWMHELSVFVVYLLMLAVLSNIYSVYKVGLYRTGELVYSQMLASLMSMGLSYLIACILSLTFLNPIPLLIALVVQTVICVLWSYLAVHVYFAIYKPKSAVVVFRRESDLQKLDEINCFERRWCIEKFIHWPEGDSHDLPSDAEQVGANEADIHRLIPQMCNYETVFVAGINATLRNGISKYCIETGKDCYFIPHTGDLIVTGSEHIKSFSVPILYARRSSPAPEYLFIKRAMDIVISLLGIIIASPFMLATAIAIKAYDKGPVLYKQIRLTRDGREFSILKFRSMKVNAEKDGVARLASENDDRITPVGKIIRAIRFDELPQLFNILKGDMTIVGPRPERPEIASQYVKDMPAFSLRLQVKAGLTGYAQVYGRYNTEPSDKLKMDLMYINNMSLVEDLKLIFATVRILFLKESTSGVAEGQTTAMGDTVAGKREESA